MVSRDEKYAHLAENYYSSLSAAAAALVVGGPFQVHYANVSTFPMQISLHSMSTRVQTTPEHTKMKKDVKEIA